MPRRRRWDVKPPSRRGQYESPYTSVLLVDGEFYLIVERQRRGFVARRLSKSEERLALRAFDDLHADLEARLQAVRRTHDGDG